MPFSVFPLCSLPRRLFSDDCQPHLFSCLHLRSGPGAVLLAKFPLAPRRASEARYCRSTPSTLRLSLYASTPSVSFPTG